VSSYRFIVPDKREENVEKKCESKIVGEPASAMTGRGMDAGVNNDADGDPRPAPEGTYPDLGADEIRQSRIYLPLVLCTTVPSP
jgi:hypothetical protein